MAKAQVLVTFAVRLILISAVIVGFKAINVWYGSHAFARFVLQSTVVELLVQVATWGIPVAVMKRTGQLGRCATSNRLYHLAFRAIAIHSLVLSAFAMAGVWVVSLYWSEQEAWGWLMIAAVLPLSLSRLNAQLHRALNRPALFQFLENGGFSVVFTIMLCIAAAVSRKSFDISIVYLVSAFLLFVVSRNPLSEVTRATLLANPHVGRYRLLLQRGTPFLASQFLTRSFTWVTVFLVATFGTESELGAMRISLQMLSLMGVIISLINAHSGPIYAKLWRSQQVGVLNAMVKRDCLLIYAMSFPILVFCLIMAKHVLTFFSTEYGVFHNGFYILCIGMTFNILCGSVGLLMQMCNQEKVFTRVLFCALVCQVIVGIVLGWYIGSWGIALSHSLGMAIWNGRSTMLLWKRCGVRSVSLMPTRLNIWGFA